MEKNFIYLDKIDATKLPKPISFKRKTIPSENTITLREPLKPYSAGTRFLTDGTYAYVLDPKTLIFKKILIPKSSFKETKSERVKDFVNLLRSWTKKNIPYVWGGCSFTTGCSNNDFSEGLDKEGTFYIKDSYNFNPKPGFDCAGLISRATQACGIPYFFKNTTTLAKRLKPLSKEDKLSEGDLIWVPGHVMIVSNQNKIIEARSYGHGYGKVQEIPISEEFKGINKYSDLVKTFHEKKPLIRLNKDGKVIQTFRDFKILKLASAW